MRYTKQRQNLSQKIADSNFTRNQKKKCKQKFINKDQMFSISFTTTHSKPLLLFGHLLIRR